MSKHSIAETKNKLTQLIARAEKGEEIIVTRHGREVARITAMDRPPAKPEPREMQDWFRSHPPRGTAAAEDAGVFVSRMRDEEWTR